MLTIFACVEDYDIDPHVNIPYDSYGNLGFEDGIIHWSGHANTYSNISIESDPYEGLNSLKLSISVDTSSFEGSSGSVLAEISKSLDVIQGDTISLSFQLRSSFNDQVAGVVLFNTRVFHDLNGQVIEGEQDTINQISNFGAVNMSKQENCKQQFSRCCINKFTSQLIFYERAKLHM